MKAKRQNKQKLSSFPNLRPSASTHHLRFLSFYELHEVTGGIWDLVGRLQTFWKHKVNDCIALHCIHFSPSVKSFYDSCSCSNPKVPPKLFFYPAEREREKERGERERERERERKKEEEECERRYGDDGRERAPAPLVSFSFSFSFPLSRRRFAEG